MERDKQLNEILEKGTEKAPINFTASVMKSVHLLAAKPFAYEPLVSPLSRRIFIMLFIAVVALIFILCLFIAASGMPFIQAIKMPDISPETYQKIVSGILIFWIVFAVNNVVTKNKWRLVSDE